jgi:hypothetical protein
MSRGIRMRGKGINYDTGFSPGGKNSRETFDADVVRRELRIIADDLHCTAVRISGGDPARLTVAGEHAAAAGLQVWFAPFPCDLTAAELVPYFADCAERAQDLRDRGADVVLVTGCELSLFAAGFIPGEDAFARIAALTSPHPRLWAALREMPRELNGFLAEAAATARKHFAGPLSYASGPWEQVDWAPFDLVGVDAYRDARNATSYRHKLRRHFVHGKPVVATEFGCCTYHGAGDRGGMGWMIIDDEAEPPRLNGGYRRDEGEQVAYLHDLLAIFEQEGVDSAFWFTFASYQLPHRPDPRYDLDMAGYGVVSILEEGRGRAYPDMGWEPKEAFHALAAAYAA